MSRGERYFRFALARELGMTYRQLIQNVDSRELAEWQAFFSIERRLSNPESPENKQKARQARNKNVEGDLKAFFRKYQERQGGGDGC